MLKLFFFNTDNFKEHNNIIIKHHKLNYVKSFNVKKVNYIGYGSILDNHQLVFSTWQKDRCWAHDSKINYLKGSDDYTFNFDERKIIITDKGQFCAHQSVVYDTLKQRYLMVGGIRILLKSRLEYITKHLNMGHSSKCFEGMKTIKYEGHDIIDNTFDHKYCKCNGLYLIKTKNFTKWNNIFNHPLKLNLKKDIIKAHITDRISYINNVLKKSDRDWATLDLYDNQPSLFYDEKKEKYILYTRDNIKTEIRYVEYHESKDYIKWDGPYNITLKNPFNFDKDNIYYFKVKQYPEYSYYIALGKYCSPIGNINGIFLYMSNNGSDWTRLSKILEDKDKHCDNCIFEGSPILSKDKQKLLFYSSYKMNTPKNSYRIYNLRPDGYSSVYSVNGTFTTKLLTLNSGTLTINFCSEKEGNLLIELLDENLNIIPNYSFKDFDSLSGDHLEKQISWNKISKITILNIYIRIKLYKTHIYSIIY